MTRARDNSFNPFNNQYAGKNKVINGDFAIWQRGTSFSNPGGVYTADRWDLSYDGSGTTRTVSRQSFTPGTAPVAGYESQYFYRYSRSGGTGGTVDYLLRQRVEDVRTFAGQTATISFWAKADSARSMGLDFFQLFGTGGSSSVYTGVGTYNLTTSWQRFTTTILIPSVSGKTINNADSALLLSYYVVSSNATWTIDIWGVQLEAGVVATSFTPAGGGLQQAELSLCQRYFQTVLNSSEAINGYENFGIGVVWATNRVLYNRIIPVTMRTSPSISLSTVGDITVENASTGGIQATNYDFFDYSPRNFSGSFYTGTSPFTIGQAARFRASATTNARIYLSAEL